MNTTIYKPARIIGGSRLIDAIEAEEVNKAELRNAIRRMKIYVPDNLLYSLDADQLELILQYRDFRVVDLPQWTDERNFVTDSNGRSFIPTEELNDAKYLRFRDAKLLSQIKDFGAYKRILITMNEETTEDRKSEKIEKILATIDPKYHAVVSTIQRDYLDDLVELCIDKYEINIRRYLAGVLRGVGSNLGIHITIKEACEALGLESSKQMLGILEELSEVNLYNSHRVNTDNKALVSEVRNILYSIKKHEIVKEDYINNILDYIEQAIDYIQHELCKVTSRPDIVLTILLLQRHLELKIRSFLTSLHQIGLIQDKEEMITCYQAFARFDRKEITEEFLTLNFNQKNEDDNPTKVEENTSEVENNSKEENKIETQGSNQTSTGEQNSEIKNTARSTYMHYLINVTISDKAYTFLIGSSAHYQSVIHQLRTHLRTGIRIQVIDPKTDTWIFWISEKPELPAKGDITIMITDQKPEFPGLPTDQYDVGLGMPGEVYRHINYFGKSFDQDQYYLITPHSHSERSQFSAMLRHQKQRLQPLISELESIEHDINTLNDLDEIYEIIKNKFDETEEGNTAIIHNIRGLFYNPENITCLLDYPLEEALNRYSKYIMQKSSKRILKHELKDILLQYRIKYEQDVQLLESQDHTPVETLRIKLKHLPELHTYLRDFLNKYRSMAIMYCHSSKAVAGQPGDEKINLHWDHPLEVAIDKMILETFQYTRIISADPSDPYISHGRLVQSQTLLNKIEEEWVNTRELFSTHSMKIQR